MRKIYRLDIVLVCLVCALFIGVSSAIMLTPQVVLSKSSNESTYVLREYKGKLALYDAQMIQIYAEYNIYTQLLPQSDVQALRLGTKVNTPQELNALLEDYGA